MKYRILSSAILCSISLTSLESAHGQSSIRLYGVIDQGITYTNSAQIAVAGGHIQGANQVALSDGHVAGLSGSRWGIRGSEELGRGLKAIFILENGFMANAGAFAQGGAEFGRQSYVGLSSDIGTVTIGRQYDPLVDFVQPLAAAGQWAGYMGAHPDDVDNLVNTNRLNNSIKYTTATYRGFSASAAYSVGGTAGHPTQNQIWGLGAGYANTVIQVGVGYLNARNPNVSFYGNTPNKGSSAANNIGSAGSVATPQSMPVYAGYASANTVEIIGAGAAYTFAPVTVGVVVTNTRFESLGSASGPNPRGYTGSASFTNAELNFRMYLSQHLLLGAAFDFVHRSSVSGDDGAKYLQLDFGADYLLSARTDVYALTVIQRASGHDSLGQPAVASITGFTPSATHKQIGVRLGIRHKF